jgi:hypothetical protein
MWRRIFHRRIQLHTFQAGANEINSSNNLGLLENKKFQEAFFMGLFQKQIEWFIFV